MPGESGWLFDVRPERLMAPQDALKFAAAGQVAGGCGWQYSAVASWRPHVHSVLDFLSSQRRPLQEPMRLQGEFLAAVPGGRDAWRAHVRSAARMSSG
ncbi:hypothetical protein [Streptomyces sp. NBC_00996]|uniref:hypothetical protein n=1 Tax=Streptomyces sp. NBC_00996 TaxID=2903710 RepID=UPI00386D4C3E|nr:hypothetical protein OG390_48570 [Streptomyces sp. NBC_00996]